MAKVDIWTKQLNGIRSLVKAGEELTGLRRLPCGCVVDQKLNNITIEACAKHKLSEIP